MGWELVGRDRELDEAARAVPTSRMIAFVGPMGVGKSRLLDEVVARRKSATRPLYRTMATEATRTISLSPFVRVLPTQPPDNPTMLLRAVADELERRGGADGLVLAVDDAHHLDAASVALLTIIVAGSAIQVVLTARTDDAWPPGLAELLRLDGCERLDVAPLDRSDADRLVTNALGSVDERLCEQLWDVAHGNPLVIREVLADLMARGGQEAVEVSSHDATLVSEALASGRVRDLTRRRLARMSPEIVAALEVVAVGSPLPIELLDAVLSAEQRIALESADLVATYEVGDQPVVRPAHPLYGELLVAQLSRSRAGEINELLVRGALAAGCSTDALQLAVWQHHATQIIDPEVALAGAEAALARHDGAFAAALVGSVFEVVDPVTAGLVLGTALVQQGRPSEAEAAFADATVGECWERPDVELLSARAFNLAFGLQRVDDADRLLRDGAEQVDSDVVRGRFDAERGVIAGIRGDFALAEAAARRTIGNDEADDAALTSAYVSLTLARTMLGRCEGFGELARLGLEAASRCMSELPLARDQILIMAACSALFSGDVAGAAEIAQSELDTSERVGAAGLPWRSALCMALACRGDLVDASDQAGRAVEESRQVDLFALAAQAVGIAGYVDGQLGSDRHRAPLDALRSEHDDPRNAVWIDRGRVWAAAAAGDLDRAVQIAVTGGREAVQRQHVGWGVWMWHDAVRFGCPDAVADAMVDAVAATDGAVLLEVMARHAIVLGDGDAEGLTRVAARFASCQAWLLAAEVFSQVAQLLDARDDATGAARAAMISMLHESRCQDPVTPELAARPVLVSPREFQVAGDAAAGNTSSEIAERRFISVRTVDNHLGAVYRTLGIGGRDELAALFTPFATTPSRRAV